MKTLNNILPVIAITTFTNYMILTWGYDLEATPLVVIGWAVIGLQVLNLIGSLLED